MHFNQNLFAHTHCMVYCVPAMATFMIFSYLVVFSQFHKYMKNWTKNIKWDCDKCEPVYFIHCKYCKYELNCSQISEFTPTSPQILEDLKHFPHVCVKLWNRSCQNLVSRKYCIQGRVFSPFLWWTVMRKMWIIVWWIWERCILLLVKFK